MDHWTRVINCSFSPTTILSVATPARCLIRSCASSSALKHLDEGNDTDCSFRLVDDSSVFSAEFNSSPDMELQPVLYYHINWNLQILAILNKIIICLAQAILVEVTVVYFE